MAFASNEAIKHALAAGLNITVLSLHSLVPEGTADPIAIPDVRGFPIELRWYVARPKNRRRKKGTEGLNFNPSVPTAVPQTQDLRHSGASRNPECRKRQWIPAYAGMTMQESLAEADFLFQPELLLRCVHEINLLTQDGKNLVGQQCLRPLLFFLYFCLVTDSSG